MLKLKQRKKRFVISARNLDISRKTAKNVIIGLKAKRYLITQIINSTENFLFMGNDNKAPVEAIGTYRLVLAK